MLLTKGSKCAFTPITKAYVELWTRKKNEGIHCIVFIAKSNTWIKGATSHKPSPRECMCVVYVEFTPFMAPLFLLVGGMATSFSIIFFSTCETQIFFFFFRDIHAHFLRNISMEE